MTTTPSAFGADDESEVQALVHEFANTWNLGTRAVSCLAARKLTAWMKAGTNPEEFIHVASEAA